MEMEGQQRLVSSSSPSTPPPPPPRPRNSNKRDFVLQWGSRKRLRCVKNNNKNTNPPQHSPAAPLRLSHTHTKRDTESPLKKQIASSSPEKDDDDKYYYSTRGSAAGFVDHHFNKFLAMDGGPTAREREDRIDGGGGSHVWPKLFVSLSSKEKEEDFMAMKGCKLPQRPKKRAKLVQRSLLLVSPGAWLSDLCQERYEVREKKASKRRPRGLKAMESESDQN